jgi:hypothetical protein
MEIDSNPLDPTRKRCRHEKGYINPIDASEVVMTDSFETCLNVLREEYRRALERVTESSLERGDPLRPYFKKYVDMTALSKILDEEHRSLPDDVKTAVGKVHASQEGLIIIFF